MVTLSWIFLSIFASFTLLQSASALFEDQVGLYDWHQQYIGRVKFASFQTSGHRKRIYLATHRNVVAALNLRTGQIAWRRVLGSSDTIRAFHLHNKYVVTVSGKDSLTVRAWSVVDGVLIWDVSILPSLLGSSIADSQIELALLKGESSPDFILSTGGSIHRISGSSGSLAWSTAVKPALRVHLWDNVAYAIQVPSNGESTVAVSILNLSSGKISDSFNLVSALELSSSFIFFGGHVVVLDSTKQKLLLAKLSSQASALTEVHLPPSDASSSLRLHDASLDHGFGLFSDGKYHLLKLNSVGKLSVLPVAEGRIVPSSFIELASGKLVNAIVNQGRATNGATKLSVFNHGGNVESVGEEVVLPEHRGEVQDVFLNAYERKSDLSFGYRFLVVGQDDSLTLLQQGEVVWEREEALASIVDSKMVDLPEKEGVTAASIERSLEEWVKHQWMITKALLKLANPEEARIVKELRLNDASKTAPTMDRHGFRKLIIALTESGKVLGLHSGDGRILWSLLLPQISIHGRQPARQMFVQKDLSAKSASSRVPVILIVQRVDQGSTVLTTVDAHSGSLILSRNLHFGVQLSIQLPASDASGPDAVLLVEKREHGDSPLAHLFPISRDPSGSVALQKSNTFFYTVDEKAGAIAGYSLSSSRLSDDRNSGTVFDTVQLWRISFAESSEEIAAIASVNPSEVVHVQTRSTPDRGVQFKYLNRNLLFVATVRSAKGGSTIPVPEEGVLTVYILDTVSGRVIHRVSHPEAHGPVHAVFSENWAVYHYLNLRNHRYEVSVIELYDESHQHSASDVFKYVLGLGGGHLTAPQSSWQPSKLSVHQQTYFFTHSVNTMAVTSTLQGITAKHLLVGTVGNQILALDKRFLDPRRTLNPTPKQKEEGIIPFAESLAINPASYLTHGVEVEGLRQIVTEPSRLESATLVFAYGIDTFYIRSAPSKTFDTLSDDFSHVLLLVTILGLAIAIGVFYVLGERRELQLKWK